MKHTQRIELSRSIGKRLVSFIAIMLFVALGVGVFLGIGWTGEALVRDADKMFEEQNMYDLQLIYPLGLDEDCVGRIAALDGVDDACGVYSAYEFCSWDGESYHVKLTGLSDRIDVPYRVSGTLPQEAGEIAVEASWAKSVGLGLGDKVTFFHDDDGSAYYLKNILEKDDEAMMRSQLKLCGMKYLRRDSYTVTALMETPEYMVNISTLYGSSAETSVAVDCLMFLPECAFDADAFTGYPVVLVRGENLRGLLSTEEEYESRAQQLGNSILSEISRVAEEKTKSVSRNANVMFASRDRELRKAKSKLQRAEKQLTEGDELLNAAKAELEANEKKLAAGQRRLAAEREKLRKAQEEIDRGRAELKPVLDEIAAAEKELAAARVPYDTAFAQYKKARSVCEALRKLVSEPPETIVEAAEMLLGDGSLRTMLKYIENILPLLDETYPELRTEYSAFVDKVAGGYYDEYPEQLAADISAFLPTIDKLLDKAALLLDEMKKELDEKTAQLADAKAQVEPLVAKLDDAQAQVDAGRAELADAEKQLRDAQQLAADARKQIEEREAELESAREEFEAGRAELERGEKLLTESRLRFGETKTDYTCQTITRKYNSGCASMRMLVDVLSRLRFTLAGLFLLVGMFVCYSALSRLVHDQIVQIGTKKALGLRNREITLSFLLFSGIAAGLGIAAGILLGTFPVEKLLIKAMTGNYNVGTDVTYFSAFDAAAVSLLELAMILLTTYFACRNILEKRAIVLLGGGKTEGGRTRFYEKTKLWKKLPLLTQTIISNCVNDKRRVIGTLVGIAGCTALVVSAFTMTDDLSAGLGRQFNELQSFDTIVYADSNRVDAVRNVRSVLNENGIDSTAVLAQPGAMRFPDGTGGSAFLYVVTEDNAGDFLHLVYGRRGEEHPITDGVWVSRAYENAFKASAGDTMTFVNSIGESYAMEIAGFFDCHLTHEQIIMNAATFRKVFGSSVEPNALLISSGGRTKSELDGMLRGTEGFAAVYDYYNTSVITFDSFGSVAQALRALYVVLSVVMAVLVLLNLLVMFVEEKKKELIVLMINGYSRKAARRYIYSDTIVLTIVGILIGMAVGTAMGMLSVTSFESSVIYVSKQIDPIACAVGAAITAVLTFVMSCVALRRIGHFKLTDLKE